MLYILIAETSASKILLGILFVVLAFIVFYYLFRLIEMAYVLMYKRPLYNHFYIYLRKVNDKQKHILQQQFSFYKKLNDKEKNYFEHRVVSFIKDKDFIGRDGIVISDEKQVLIAATAVMLTFGFRDFYIGIISKIVIYPEVFYSKINGAYHKGEFNPMLQALVFSWEDFQEGYRINNDNLNLGIHEFTHAIHLNSLKERDISSTIFKDSFKELSVLLNSKVGLKERLTKSEYFRGYAYTNQFEFLAVVIENFIETPQDFRSEFPFIYSKIKQMLNFNVAGY